MINNSAYKSRLENADALLKLMYNLFALDTGREAYDLLGSLLGYLRETDAVILDGKQTQLQFTIAGRSFFIEPEVPVLKTDNTILRTFERIIQTHKLLPSGKIKIVHIAELDILRDDIGNWKINNATKGNTLLFEYSEKLIQYLEKQEM